MATWRQRGRCPHAIDSSSQLVEAKLTDLGFNIAVGGDQVLRSMYAMSLVRAVNGIVDSGQKGSHATSVQVINI